MKLITEVALPPYPFRLDHQMPTLLMGSCFTENIGKKLERYRFPVRINPFGVTYNPLSVKKGLEVLMDKPAYTAADLDFHNELWFSFDHYTGFSSTDQGEALDKINRSLESAKDFLRTAGVLILTWGTSWVYTYNKTGEVVCNCHKIPAREFTRTRLSSEEIAAAYETLVPRLLEFNSQLKILYTISPVRHWKDGAHGNQLSKASLLLAGEALQNRFPDTCFYFPSYEIVMDELRDYRFYTEDMLHTSEGATSYIWEKLKTALLSDSSKELINDLEPLLKMVEHRPVNTGSSAQQILEKKVHEKLELLKIKYSGLDLGDLV